MVVTPSEMVPLGTVAPDFSLIDVVSERKVSLKEISTGKKATVVMFICNHCPYVKHIQKALVKLVAAYQAREVGFVAINANDVASYPDDSPENMRQVATEWSYSFPYLYDATQEVALAYRAACTPDFFVFNSDLKLAYRGQLDKARPGNDIPVTGEDLAYALDCILAGKTIDKQQRPSAGCNIKWKQKE
ncbi:MAG: thioredoxin family protein [Chlamydiota bacterium]